MGLDYAELQTLRAIRRYAGHPLAIRMAQALSHFGEHSLGWIAVGAVGALLDSTNRFRWLVLIMAALIAHGTSSAVKRVIRRQRPQADDLPPLCSTPSALSFPSSHAASTTAAAILLIPVIGAPLALLVIGAMGFSRLLLGVHYPTDVLTGITIGTVVGTAAMFI